MNCVDGLLFLLLFFFLGTLFLRFPGLSAGDILPVAEFFIIHIFIQKFIDTVHIKARGDLTERIDLDIKTFQVLMHTWFFRCRLGCFRLFFLSHVFDANGPLRPVIHLLRKYAMIPAVPMEFDPAVGASLCQPYLC